MSRLLTTSSFFFFFNLCVLLYLNIAFYLIHQYMHIYDNIEHYRKIQKKNILVNLETMFCLQSIISIGIMLNI